MKFVENNIQSVEVVNYKRGGQIIITLNDDSLKPRITFRTKKELKAYYDWITCCLLYTSPSPRDLSTSRMPSSA